MSASSSATLPPHLLALEQNHARMYAHTCPPPARLQDTNVTCLGLPIGKIFQRKGPSADGALTTPPPKAMNRSSYDTMADGLAMLGMNEQVTRSMFFFHLVFCLYEYIATTSHSSYYRVLAIFMRLFAYTRTP